MESHKGAHQGKDSPGGSGLRVASGEFFKAANVLNLLFVPVQNENHGATGPDYEHRKDNFRKCNQCCI